MNTNTEDKELQDAKEANKKSRMGTMSNSTSSYSSGLEEARKLNSQSATSSTSGMGYGYSSSLGDTDTDTYSEEEAKKQNEQSRQNKQ